MRHSRGSAGQSAGFSLVELLMVASIVLVLGALASTYTWRAILNANEASAVASMRVITGAVEVYLQTYEVGYPSTLSDLAPPPTGEASEDGADLIPPDLAAGRKSGYTFTYKTVTALPSGRRPRRSRRRMRAVVFTLTAEPTRPNFSGRRFFYTDEKRIIRYDDTRPADFRSRPL